MNGYLLDTNIALIGVSNPDRLPQKIRRVVDESPPYISVVSYWEVALKSSKGKLDVDPRRWWIRTLDELGASALLLKPEHISAICDLQPFHADPFDRVLIAQAIAEDLTFITTDTRIAKYASATFRVLH